MNVAEKRQRYRQVLNGGRCIYPASVYDPLTARMADSLGCPVGMLAGSVASAVVVGAPDIAVLTLTEFADLIHRITRNSDLSLMVDADHGYGTAMSVMRMVQELEAAGLCAMTIEDTWLPEPFRKQPGQEMIPMEEMVGKLKAALAARHDSGTCIVARTSALTFAGMDEMLRRVKTYSGLGVDGVFLTGITKVEELKAVRQVTGLPLLLGSAPEALRQGNTLAEHGVRIALPGHQPFWSAVKAAYEAMKHIAEGGNPSDLRDKVASPELTELVTAGQDYKRWQQEYLS